MIAATDKSSCLHRFILSMYDTTIQHQRQITCNDIRLVCCYFSLIFQLNISQYYPNAHTGPHMSDRKMDTLHSCAHTHTHTYIPSFQCRKQKQQQLTRTHTRAYGVCIVSTVFFFSSPFFIRIYNVDEKKACTAVQNFVLVIDI